MKREEILQIISKCANCDISEDTVISSCNDLDSLALLNIFTYFKSQGYNLQLTDFIVCKTVKDIISLIDK